MQSTRLKFRKIVDTDIDHVFEGLSHPEVIRFYGVSYDSLEATRRQMEWFQELERQKTGRWWAVCRKDDSRFVGAGGFNNWDPASQKAEIGFWLLPEFWGLGFMTEAMPILCEYGFDVMDLHRIEGFVDSENRNCKRALAKLEFVHEGCMRECESKDGRRVSIDIYSRLRAE